MKDSDETILAPGAPNALTARIAQDAGFSTVYASGAGIANWALGVPDLGLASMSDVVGEVARICAAVDIPVIADADTGYGNALNVFRCVREFERAGVAAIQLEDQVHPKRCGHFDGKSVIDASEMVAKIKAATDARQDPDLVLIARTDARAVYDLETAIERAQLYREAGADVIFLEAPRTVDELAEVAKAVDGPLVANIVEGGKTPAVSRAELTKMGYALVLYANLGPRAAMMAMKKAFAHLKTHGDSEEILNDIVTMPERNRLTGMDFWKGLEASYAG
ncbi:carboxyvinyl-carboxyphosphonate phosphorylmutase [Hyphomonas adhaerens MHS-3]|uniref:2-methylisocitrate lyase n=1 Tax=Hyphomonas adhaerens MHS-3 TaxID=1280949 RepID=A0A069E7Q8_9PROT|nr:isocitrate lyase/PEP mutase family protein [Hyphomonas adhaerens]KCZ86014.1 carboxyvinyl-carboxyphosphonate phosphorylmutase [Hyphomonas adhaerens MHS-3]